VTLDHHTLRLAGEALFGASLWRSALAGELGVSARTMQRWAAGTYPVPSMVWAEIAHLCRARGTCLTEIADEFDSLRKK
jgi:hypothetical protein